MTVGRRASRAAFAAVVVITLVAWASAAAAHPGGPPPQAHISADGNEVLVGLTTEPDDAALIAVELGILGEAVADAYIEGDSAEPLDAGQRREVSQHPAVADYLLEHVRVSQDGAPCDGTVTDIVDLFREQARLAYACPSEVSSIEVTVTILLHRDEAYRTFGLGVDAEPDLTVFTTASPSHTFDFTAAPDTAPADERRLSQSLPWMGLLLPVGVGAALWRRRSRP